MTPTVLEPGLLDRPRRHDCRRTQAGTIVELAWFAGIGLVMTSAYLVLYSALTPALGMQGANVVAWVLTALVDTSANRRMTFGVRGRAGALRAQVESLLVFAAGMVVTSGSLVVLGWWDPSPSRLGQLGVLVVANIVAGLLRFILLQRWVFAAGRMSRPDRALGADGRSSVESESHGVPVTHAASRHAEVAATFGRTRQVAQQTHSRWTAGAHPHT